jgi:formylglycine-generating enzyme required for sulfatase activity
MQLQDMAGLRAFICHASEDKPRVRELCARLRERGFDPWMDEERLLPGHDWELEISDAVRASDVIIVCLSAASVRKVGYVQKELRRVLDLAEQQPEGRIFVIPVRLGPCAVPRRLSQWQYADLFVEGGYDRLSAALRSKAGEERTGPGVTSTPPPPLILANRGRRNLPQAFAVTILLIGTGIAVLIYYYRAVTTPPKAAETKEVPTGMVPIRGGSFLMGRNGALDPEASPAHEVIVKTFYIDKTPVTNAEFREFLRASNRPAAAKWNVENLPPDQDKWPVTEVTWDDAYAYCHAQGKRLPSEAEWEYAARGTDGRLYPWGEEFNAAAVNSRESGIGRPEPVGAREANRSAFDVADMSGNIWQWCADDYRPYPGRKPDFTIPPGAKAIRGGSFQSERRHVSAITRNLERPATRSPEIGFRCAK